MADPVLLGAGLAAVAIAIVGAYAAYSGEDAEVEVSDEGITAEFGDDEEGDTTGGGERSLTSEGTGVTEVDATSATTEPPTVEDLTRIDGVGEATAENLSAAGFDTVNAIADAPISALVEAEGVGEKRASTLALNAAGVLNDAVAAGE